MLYWGNDSVVWRVKGMMGWMGIVCNDFTAGFAVYGILMKYNALFCLLNLMEILEML